MRELVIRAFLDQYIRIIAAKYEVKIEEKKARERAQKALAAITFMIGLKLKAQGKLIEIRMRKQYRNTLAAVMPCMVDSVNAAASQKLMKFLRVTAE